MVTDPVCKFMSDSEYSVIKSDLIKRVDCTQLYGFLIFPF